MEKRFYKAFTLIEMLIVMGIIMILIGVGVAGTRYALDSANKIKLENAVDNLNQALLSYFADNREYPEFTNFGTALATGGALNEYMETGEFDGGPDTTYYYWLDDTNQQAFLVCVALGGQNDEKLKGFYCNGNGFGTDSGIADQNIENTGSMTDPLGTDETQFTAVTDWTNEDNSWEAAI